MERKTGYKLVMHAINGNVFIQEHYELQAGSSSQPIDYERYKRVQFSRLFFFLVVVVVL